MSVIILPEPTGSIYPPSGAMSRPPSLAAKLAARLRRFGKGLSDAAFEATMEFRLRRAARELRMLDDHMLRDIGISRSEIDRIVRYGRENDMRSLRAVAGMDDFRND